MKNHPSNNVAEVGGAKGMAPVIHLKKILVPVDFSKASKKALQYANSFAGQFGAELTLLHVIQPAVTAPAFDTLPQELAETTEDAERSLADFRSTVDDGILTKCLIRKGSPHMEIIDLAKELEVDLVVLSTHGRTGLSHVLLGSTAEKVVRRAGCPVLIVREHEHEFIDVGGPNR